MDGDEMPRLPPVNGWLSGGVVAADDYDSPRLGDAILASLQADTATTPDLALLAHSGGKALLQSYPTHHLQSEAPDDGEMKPAARPDLKKGNSNFTQLISPQAQDVASDNSKMIANHYTESATTKDSVSGAPPIIDRQSIRFMEDSNAAGRIQNPTPSNKPKPAAAKGRIIIQNPYPKPKPAAAKGRIIQNPPYLKPKPATASPINPAPPLYSQKQRRIPIDSISEGVPNYTGSNESLLHGVLGFSLGAVKVGMESLATQGSEAADASGSFRPTAEDTTQRVDGLARMASVFAGEVTSQRPDTTYEPYAPNAANTATMCQAVDGMKNIVYNDVHFCQECSKEPATTSRPAKAEDAKQGPNSHPLTTCGHCAKILGGEWLHNPAGCFCGNERNCQGSYMLSKCLCPKHLSQYEKTLYEKKQDVHECRRCQISLLFNRKSKGGKGVARDICSNSPCVDKCVFQDANGWWCENERGMASCYCPTHASAQEAKRKKVYHTQKKSGTFVYKEFQPEELSVLSDLIRNNKNPNGTVNWKVVAPLFQERFKNQTKYSQKTEKQLRQKYKTMNTKAKKTKDKKQRK
eukprot:scaffold1371_cov77-Skeletonema_dohrnii-CCMP3373.AAC.2